jgi:DnaK suppressor protein
MEPARQSPPGFVSLAQLMRLALGSDRTAPTAEKEDHGRAQPGIQGINRGHDGVHSPEQGRIEGFFSLATAGAADARRREVKAQPKVAAKTKTKPAAKAKAPAKPAKPAAKAARPAAKAAVKKTPAKTPANKTSSPQTNNPPAKAARPAAKTAAKTSARSPVKAVPAKAAAPAKSSAGKALGAVAKAVLNGAKAVVAAAKKLPAKAAPAKAALAKASSPSAASPAAAAQPVKAPAQPVKAAPSAPARTAPVPAPAPAAPAAAKASYTPMATQSVLTPPPVVAIKKDPKLANNWKTKSAEELSDAEVLAMPDSEYMNEKQMAFFRQKLLQLKQEILNSAGETTEHLREDTVIVPDPADRATIEEEHALELRTRDRERKLLKKIEQSIARIDAGDYGYCDETGEPIGVGRLLARPTATLSLEAQQRRELKQKMFGD